MNSNFAWPGTLVHVFQDGQLSSDLVYGTENKHRLIVPLLSSLYVRQSEEVGKRKKKSIYSTVCLTCQDSCCLSAASWKFSSMSHGPSVALAKVNNSFFASLLFTEIGHTARKSLFWFRYRRRNQIRKDCHIMRATCSLCLSFQKIEVAQFPKEQMTQETVMSLVFLLILLHSPVRNNFQCHPCTWSLE